MDGSSDFSGLIGAPTCKEGDTRKICKYRAEHAGED